MIVLMYTKILLYFRISPRLGPLVRTFISMLRELTIFCAMFAILILVYANFFSAVLADYSSEKSLGEYLFFFFDMLTGSVSLVDSFNYIKDPRRKLITQIGSLTFSIIGTIMLVNLLIAVFTNVYTLLMKKSQSLLIKQIIDERPVHQFDPHYSGLTNSPFPFNALAVPFIPFYWFFKSQKLNNFVLKIEHFFIVLILLPLFTLVSFTLSPLAFFKCVAIKIKILKRR